MSQYRIRNICGWSLSGCATAQWEHERKWNGKVNVETPGVENLWHYSIIHLSGLSRVSQCLLISLCTSDRIYRGIEYNSSFYSVLVKAKRGKTSSVINIFLLITVMSPDMLKIWAVSCHVSWFRFPALTDKFIKTFQFSTGPSSNLHCILKILHNV